MIDAAKHPADMRGSEMLRWVHALLLDEIARINSSTRALVAAGHLHAGGCAFPDRMMAFSAAELMVADLIAIGDDAKRRTKIDPTVDRLVKAVRSALITFKMGQPQ